MSMENHCGMISRGETPLFGQQMSLTMLPSHIAANWNELGEGKEEFGLRNMFIIGNDLLICSKIYDIRPTASFPLRSKACCGFLSPLEVNCLCRIWTSEHWIQWQASYSLHHIGDFTAIRNSSSRKFELGNQGFISVAHYYKARDEQTFETGPRGNIHPDPTLHPHKNDWRLVDDSGSGNDNRPRKFPED
jgi:hypothetical protein